MTEMPCHDCANLIGTMSATSPHAELEVQAIKNQRLTGTDDHRVEFHRCRKCQMLLARDLHKEDPYAQWDWVKARKSEDSLLLETHR